MRIDWSRLIVPELNLIELIIRGSIIYIALFFMLRFFIRRQQGSLSVMDLLLILLIADASQNAMAGEYKSITEGLVLCGTIIAWSLLFEWLCFHFPSIRRWLEPAPLLLIQDGKLNRHNLRKEMITEEELMAHLRKENLESVDLVKKCYFESDGEISVIKK